MNYYVGDFETTTDPNNCHVWAWAVCEVGNTTNMKIGTTIEEFIEWCSNPDINCKVYFHNLKFDGEFILNYLFKNGYEHITDKRKRKSKTFMTTISDMGLWYQFEVIFYKKGSHVNKVVFLDSLKLLPLSVKEIAKSFHMEIQKLEIDYHSHNNLPYGSPLTDIEREYIKHDILIVANAIEYFHKQGLTKMTIGSCAMDEYKKLIRVKNFKMFFPTPKFHDDVKQSYRGGFTYLNPKFKEKTVKNGIVLDVNSLYPSVMYDCYLPYGTPIFFKGKYENDPVFPLYTQMFRCMFTLKEGKIPTIQIKYGMGFKANEYLTSSNNQEVVLCLNSVDLKLFFENYNVTNVEYLSGWKFKSSKGLFKDYIDKWSGIKIQSKKDKNHGMYLIAKLFLNSLYGKFGTNNKVRSKVPKYDKESGLVSFQFGEVEERNGIYIAMASFITSYAREKTIRSAQKIMDNYNEGKSNIEFIYADTDSLHCLSPDFKIPEGLEIHDTKLGAWKFESKFNKARFLRQKCYIENSTEDVLNDNPDYELKITVAGMPVECYPHVNFKNFKIGAKYQGKKVPHIVPGGVVLEEIDFTINK